MCIICEQFKNNKLTIGEAIRNYGEMKESLPEEHQKEMEEKLFNNFPSYIDIKNILNYDEEYWKTLGFAD